MRTKRMYVLNYTCMHVCNLLNQGPDPRGLTAGGTLHVTSPGGNRYPRALPWDMSAEDLELALEWTNDVGEVTVSYAEDGSTRSYKVTFDVRKSSCIYRHERPKPLCKARLIAMHCFDRKSRGLRVFYCLSLCGLPLSRRLLVGLIVISLLATTSTTTWRFNRGHHASDVIIPIPSSITFRHTRCVVLYAPTSPELVTSAPSPWMSLA